MIPYIDMHCDTLMKAWLNREKDLFDMPRVMASIKQLRQGGCGAQFFAIFMPPADMNKLLKLFVPGDDRYIDKLYQIFMNTVEKHSDIFAQALTPDDIVKNSAEGKLSGVLTIEDGRAVDSSMEKLEHFFSLGVRLISLTWNSPNCFGSPNSPNKQVMEQGLTSFGRDAVARMGELGMLVDVSHLSDGGFRDVADICKGPFVASHSNCRAINPHQRSLTDDMLRTLAAHGGVTGVNFGPMFLTQDVSNRASRTPDIMNHLRHMIDVGGVECAAIGTDFDGVSGLLEINSAAKMQYLFESMEKAGFTTDEIERVAYRNVMRVLGEVIKPAAVC